MRWSAGAGGLEEGDARVERLAHARHQVARDGGVVARLLRRDLDERCMEVGGHDAQLAAGAQAPDLGGESRRGVAQLVRAGVGSGRGARLPGELEVDAGRATPACQPNR
jgi:hypothetical protein